MNEMILDILAPTATVIAAVIAARASVLVRKAANRNEQLNRESEARLAELNHVLTIASQQAKERYSLRANALVEASRLAGETCYYLERYLVSYTVHQPATREHLIQRAEQSFEELMKFRWEQSLFLWHNDAVAKALSDMMGGINAIRATEPEAAAFSQEQAERFLETVTPALAVIRDEFTQELMRVEL